MTRWWFQICFIFIRTWGNDPILLIFFRWVETTNQIASGQIMILFGCFRKQWGFLPNHPFFNRVFHYFHHPFWGPTPIFGNTHLDMLQQVWENVGSLKCSFLKKPICVWEKLQFFGSKRILNPTVDGRNPAPVDRQFLQLAQKILTNA